MLDQLTVALLGCLMSELLSWVKRSVRPGRIAIRPLRMLRILIRLVVAAGLGFLLAAVLAGALRIFTGSFTELGSLLSYLLIFASAMVCWFVLAKVGPLADR